MGTRMLPHRQWRLLNIIYGHMVLDETRNAERLLKWADVDRDDAVALAHRKLLRANRDAAPYDQVRIDDARLDWARLDLTLTPRGVGWWGQDPYNHALCAAAWHSSQSPAPLRRIREFATVDVDALLALVDAGLVSITADSAAPVRLSAAVLTDPTRAWSIRVTAAGRQVLGA
jgi:hypothetical protein